MLPIMPILPFNDPPLIITYLGTNGTGLAIGPARSDRYIVAIGYGENDAAGSMTSCTFDGAAGTIIYSPSRSDSFGMAYKQVTTGTTVTVSISQFGFSRAEFYMITGVKTGLYGSTANSSSGTSLSCSNATPTGKVALIMGAASRDLNGSFTATAVGGATNVVLNHSGNFGGGGNPSWWAASGYTDKSGSSSGISCNGSSAFSSGVGVIAAFA